MKWLLIILFFPVYGRAQDSTGRTRKFELHGYVKEMQTLLFNKNFTELIGSNLIHNRINLKWKPVKTLTLAAEMRNRLFWGEEIRATPNFSRLLQNPSEKMNLDIYWIDRSSYVLHSTFDRLYADYHTDRMNLRLGRQRINWGTATTWNPNDLFNVYNFLDFDYEERPGSDAARMQLIFKNSFNAEFAYALSKQRRSEIAALKLGWNRWSYDWQVIGGMYKKQVTVGGSWAGPIEDAGFKGEFQYFFRSADSVDHLNLSVEADYMFKKGWYLNVGVLLNNRGINRSLEKWDTLNLSISPLNLMPTRWNLMISGSKAITPLFTLTNGIVYSPGSNLIILLPGLQYNMATNFDINLVWQSFFASIQHDLQGVGHRGFLRFKWSF